MQTISMKKRCLEIFQAQWMQTVHFLSEYGQICGVEEYKDLDLRVANVTDEERNQIFNSVFFCASIENLDDYDFQTIGKNMFYTLDTKYVNDLMEDDQFYFLWKYSDEGKIFKINIFQAGKFISKENIQDP